MARLSTIIIKPRQPHVYGHGLTWDTACSLLSIPSLSRLALIRVYLCPKPTDAATLQLHPSTSVSNFEYTLLSIRDPYSRPSEVDALDRIIRLLHLSLEELSLPVEPAPMHTISRLDWPRLCVLKLRGLLRTSPTLPIVGLLAGMTNLRVLVLELSEREGTRGNTLWPQGFAASYPWPYLESLSVSYPDPEDQIYAHLPRTLHTLMLQSWPHQCIRRWQVLNYDSEELRPYRSPLSSSVMLDVLRRCTAPDLQVLRVEYFADYNEIPLLSYAVRSFPRITTLELHRYRHHGDKDVPVVSLCQFTQCHDY